MLLITCILYTPSQKIFRAHNNSSSVRLNYIINILLFSMSTLALVIDSIKKGMELRGDLESSPKRADIIVNLE
jgi:hypothetical protein